ncbi:MAG: DUF4013 domain-containing protein [Oscillochloris sp.]|nr:DUF4013 domain-containing protein [Oscillochloris sp.]
MDLARAFSYVLDDEQWIVTVLIGGLLLLVPILGPIMLTGFMLEAARNVAAGNPRPLPRWDRFGEKFIDGLYGIIIQIVYNLPVILFSCLLACIAVVAVIGGTSEEEIGILMAGLSLCIMPVVLLLSIVLQPVTLAALARYVQTGSLSETLKVGDVVQITRSDLGAWVVLWLLQILCSFVGSLGSALLVIGVFFTMFYSQAVFGHLLGQTVQRMNQDTPPPTPYAPPPSYS